MKFIKSIFDLVVFILTMVICLFAFGTFLGGILTPNFHWITYMMGFIAFPVIFSLFLVTFYWIYRMSFVVILPIIFLIINGQYITAVINFSEKKTPTVETIKIGTYNVRHFKDTNENLRTEEVANYIKEENLDIIAFQEYAKDKDISNYLSDYKYKTTTTKDDSQNTVIYSKYPILNENSEIFPDSGNGYSYADIKINTKTLRVISVHLQTTEISNSGEELKTIKNINADTSDESLQAASTIAKRLFKNSVKRNEQFKIVKRLTDTSLPVILLGDFNDQPSSNIYFKTIETGLTDGFKSAGNGYMYTFKRFMNILRIDYIFHSKGISVYDYYSDNLPYSDHNPVIMEFSIKD